MVCFNIFLEPRCIFFTNTLIPFRFLNIFNLNLYFLLIKYQLLFQFLKIS